MSDLKAKLRKNLIEYLNLEDINIDDFKDDTPLFGQGLELDSIDALEIIVMLEKEFNVKITNPEEGAKIFQNINSIAEYIESNQ